jgi:hypothetical protein
LGLIRPSRNRSPESAESVGRGSDRDIDGLYGHRRRQAVDVGDVIIEFNRCLGDDLFHKPMCEVGGADGELGQLRGGIKGDPLGYRGR